MRAIQYFAFATLLTGSAALTQDNDIPIRDLGVKQIGADNTLTLTAKNLNCPTPQDFEFQTDNMPWLIADGPLIVRQLGPGQSRSIKAKLDFRYTQPGVHFGRLTSRCITCGWHVFASCNENAQDLVLKVTVADPSNAAAPAQGSNNPYAGMKPRRPFRVALASPLGENNVQRIDKDKRKDLIKARGRLNAAKAAGQKAQEDLRNAQRKKSDCERELARLKAEAAAAERAAKTAKQDAKNAAGAAKAAAKALKDFEKDNKKALKKVQSTAIAVGVAKDYLAQVTKADGPGSGRVQRAQDQVDRFQEQHFDALREHSAVTKSHEARKAAAEKTKADSKAAAAKAKAAAAKAKAAQDKVKAKAKICGGAADAVTDAQKALDDARSAANDAVTEANKAEAAATKDALEKIDEEIEKCKKDCKKAEEDAKKEIAKWKEAIEAGQELKMLDDDGGAAASKMKEVNDKIWDAARDLANEKALTPPTTAEGILGQVNQVMGMAVDAASSALGGISGVVDFAQSELLGGLKALGLAVQSQVNAIRNPNTYGAKRNKMAAELNNKDSYLVNEMKDKGIGKNSKDRKDILDRIEKLHSDRNLVADMIERFAKQAAECAAKLKKLEAERAALAKKAKG